MIEGWPWKRRNTLVRLAEELGRVRALTVADPVPVLLSSS